MNDLNTLDPLELNRGQLIHFLEREREEKLNIDRALSVAQVLQKSDILNVEKKREENAVFVDWFEVTILLDNVPDNRLDRIQLHDHVWLENLQRSSRLYFASWSLIYLGEKVAEIKTHPNNSQFNQAQLKIENFMLYRCDWLDIYKDIFSLLRWSHRSLTRLDIAIDGKAPADALKLASRHLKGRVIGRKGKAAFSAKYNHNKDIISFHVGSMSSDKNATIYDKTKEIEKSEKSYIVEAWKRNGINTDSVKRFEIRMRSKVTSNYDWTKLDDLQYLASIVRTETKNWFEFYYMGKDKNKHRVYKNNSVNWIDWNSIKGDLLPKHEAVASTGIHRAKRVIKDSKYFEFMNSNSIDHVLIHRLINEYSLHTWYERKLVEWHSEWTKEKRYSNIISN